MAAPVISGIAAIIRSYYPALTAEQVKEAILESTVPSDLMVRQPGTDNLIPFSDLSVAGGVVDIVAAVTKASQMKGKKKLRKSRKSEIRP